MRIRVRFLLTATSLFVLAVEVVWASIPTAEIVVDIISQPDGVTVTRPLAIRCETSIDLVIVGVRGNAGYTVAINVDDVAMPSFSLAGVGAALPANARYGRLLFADTSDAAANSASARPAGPAATSAHGVIPAEHAGPGGSPAGTSGRFSGSMGSGGAGPDSLGPTEAFRLADVARFGPGSRLVVTINKAAAGRDRERVWTTVLTAPPRGSWRISVGFAFPIMLQRNREYVTRADTGHTYRVARASDDAVTQPVPTVLFHWLPSVDAGNDWSASATGGIGIDLAHPMILLGASLTYNQNLTVAVGAVAHSLRRLNTRYLEGDHLSEPVADEQLHRAVYGVNPFVAVTFRFAGDPFGK